MIIENDATQLYSLLQSINAIVWKADSDMSRFLFIDEHIKTVLGFPHNSWLQTPNFWAGQIHPDDISVIERYRALKNDDNPVHVFEYRMLTNTGAVVWIKDTVSLAYSNDEKPRLCGVMLDVTLTKRLQAVEKLERDILQINSDLSTPVNEVLLTYLRGLEQLFPQMHCSIHRVVNGKLMNGLAVTLPKDYMDSLIGHPIGENEGSCGSAAALKQRVIVSDLSKDHRWEKFLSVVSKYNLAACWANPVINAEGEVIAVLGMYYNTPKTPGKEELEVMEKTTSLLRIILEDRQHTETVREANLLMLQSQDLAHFGNWRWDIVNDVVSWSPALYNIYGLDQYNFKATFEGYMERLHPDDKESIFNTIMQVLNTGVDAEFEERVFRPDGSMRYLRSWAKLKKDENGKPLEMIGACLDNTQKVLYANAIEQQSRQLLDIAWLQSHAIRSPLVRILGITELLQNADNSEEERKKLLIYLSTSAHELDEQIKLISQKTEVIV
ncbi:PAS domain-containing protein [Mucilaginibacter auburnensis]|uniref:histidine kinase n=1 Tax=Mucilaginibacter auburnensis TaxID=1457233 RepID=A0A2H9VSZ0_9SPHI|nr:PAS domain-containing protein [Mucilaginibacter auburnensis]PJJ83935.1 GAF domain-containing protein [Mucilaginibacter auburnensis]